MRYSRMLDVVLSNRFKKDLKNRDHALTGDYIGFRECHIRPDWLLVYRVDGEDLILFLFRTGSHTDLFD